MPLFSRSRSSTNSAGGAKDGGQQYHHHHHHQSNNPSRPSTPGSHSHSAPGTPRPSSSSGAPYSPSTLLANFINRRKSNSGSNSSSTANTTSAQSYQSIVSASGRSSSGTAMAAPDAARAYLAALAARSHERHLNGSATGTTTTGKSGSAPSFVSSQSSSDDGLVASSISSFSEVSSIASSAGDNNSNAPVHSPSSFTSSITSPSFLKRRRGNTNTSSSGGSRTRALSDSLKQFASETGLGEQLVYSNDYHVPVRVSEASQLSRHPPRLANKLLPARHFDLDPSYVPPALKDDPASTRHAEFGYQNEKFEYKSQYRKSTGVGTEEIEEPAHYVYITTYISYLLLIVIGHLRDFIGKRTHRKSYQHLMPYNGYAALNSDFDSFYTRRLKARIEDLFARPVTGVAGRTITCLDRISTDHYATFRFTGLTTQALNISSYNYLGFNQSKGGCADAVEEAIKTYGVSSLGNRQDAGTLDLHVHAERLVARFLGVEDTLLISQGFATNSATLPVLVSKGCLVISDEHNHASIRFGVRLSGAVVKQYKHNDMRDLEKVLRESISQGQPRTHRPWKKILLIVEGLYSMEGTLVDLPKILDLKRKYKFYLYVDEAHSIGALGPRGRGVCDYFSIDPNQIDILMGTLTKSFGAAGGYIAGSKQLIDEMRRSNHSSVYGEAHSPAVLMQIISSIVCIMGREALEVVPGLQKYLTKRMLDGTEGVDRLRRLAFNSRYLSTGLRKLGFIVYGHRDSPIVPLLMFSPGKMGSFSRLMLEKFNIVTVVVAYPATPLVSSRVRFCVSAAHTKQDIDRVLIACDVVGDILGLKLSNMRKRMSIGDIIANSRELVEAEDA